MGKATILASLGAGHYRIRVEFDNVQIEARLTFIAQQIIDLTAQLATLAIEKQTALDQFNTDIAAMNAYIDNTPPEVYAENPEILSNLQAAAYKSKAAYDLQVTEEKRAKLKKTGIEKDKEYLTKYCPKEFETTAWCVAYNEDLTGVIKSIECDYLLERDVVTNFPLHDTGFWLPETVQAPDSQLQHPLASSVHAVWFNLALYPAAQRDKGRYRIATITSLDKDADKCNLTFDGYYNFHEKISTLVDDKPIFPHFYVNDAQQQNYVDADVLYMTCNAEAFEVGDRVVVDLHNGAGVPTVIGFYENPRECPQTWPTSITLIGKVINSGVTAVKAYTQFGTDLWCHVGEGADPPYEVERPVEEDDQVTDYTEARGSIYGIVVNAGLTPTAYFNDSVMQMGSNAGFSFEHIPENLTSEIYFRDGSNVSVDEPFMLDWEVIPGAFVHVYTISPGIVDFIATISWTNWDIYQINCRALPVADFSNVPRYGGSYTESVTASNDHMIIKNNTTGETKTYYAAENQSGMKFIYKPLV